MWVIFGFLTIPLCLLGNRVAEGTRLYPAKTMRGSVASQAGTLDGCLFIHYILLRKLYNIFSIDNVL